MTATASLRLEYRIEEEPLGTGGAIRFAAEGIDGPFFALNGDSLRETDLDALVAFHRERPKRATILLTPVEDPTRYGLVRVNGDGQVLSFLEKPRPEEIDTNLINAGLYVLEPDVLDLIPAGPSRLDRARGLPAARRRAGGLRSCARGLLARHRDTGRLSAGASRCARAELHDRARRRARPRLHAGRPGGRRQPRCAAGAAGLRRRGREDRRRRSHRQPCGDRRGRSDRRRMRASSLP